MVMRFIKTAMLGIAIVILSAGWSTPTRAADVSFDFFYSNLSPHGSWMVSAEYGQVWQPRVYASDWNPYYDGHWVYTDLGWTWVSDYSWGTVPYHYGTWVMDADYGWVWVPGYVWAPSWVVFRTGPNYIGWAPVSPNYSLNVSMSFGQPTSGPFIFVSSRDFVAPRVRRCVIPEQQTTVIINNTRIVNSLTIENSVVVNRGPSPRLVESASGQPIREMRIEQVRGVTPEPHVDRAKLRVDPQRMREGLRVAEPTRGEQRQLRVPQPEYRQDDSDQSRRPDGMNHRSQPQGQPQDSVTPRANPQGQPQESVAPRPNPHGQPRDSMTPRVKPQGQPQESVAPRSNPRGQPRDSVTPRVKPQGQPQQSVAPRPNPHGQPPESLQPSGKSGKPLPPKGADDKQGKQPDKKKKPPKPKKDSGNETGHPDAH